MYWENPSRHAQVRAFARRAGLAVPERPAEEFLRMLQTFLTPVLDDLRTGSRQAGSWRPAGPLEEGSMNRAQQAELAARQGARRADLARHDQRA
jgi:hypothetical protein